MNNAQNVSVGKPKADGAVFTGSSTVTLPVDAVTELDPGFSELGYVSDKGLTNTVKTESNQIKAWGGDVVLEDQTSRSEQYKLVLIESGVPALKQYFGPENVVVSESGAISILGNSKARPSGVWVFETLLNDNKVQRIVLPNAKVTELGDITYTDSDAIGYDLTISALPDANGNTSYRYIALLETSEG